MTAIKIDRFYGEVPRTSARHLAATQAQVAMNCRLLNGNLHSWQGAMAEYTPSKAGVINSIYRFAGAFWFHWTENVDVVRAPISNITDRTIFTGTAAGPQITDNAIATAGGTLYPMQSWDLGIPAPVITATVAGTPNADASLNESRAYVYTYVSAWGEEGPPSPASAIIDIDPALAVNISAMSGVPAGNYNITKKRIYRSNTSGVDTAYQFVAEVPVGTAAYADTIAGSSLGETLQTTAYDMPPSNMIGIIALPNGILAGFSGNEVCFSEPFQPHAWPVKYRLATTDPIVGLGSFGSTICVTTTGTPYYIVGVHPASMSMDKTEVNQACVSKNGMVDMGYHIAYPSPDGMVIAGPTGPVLATEKLYKRKEWQLLNPSTIHGYLIDDMYIGFYDATATGGVKGGFILDPKDPEAGLTFIDIHATGGYADPLTDTLYLIDSTTNLVVAWDRAPTAMNYVWKSKRFALNKPVNFAYSQVHAKAYPVTVKYFADGVLKHTASVTSRAPFALPDGFLADEWEMQIEGSVTVDAIYMAQSMSELRVM